MTDRWTVLDAVLPVFVIVMAGAVIRRLGWLTLEADRSLTRLILNVLFPCLIVDALLGNRALEHWGNLVLAPLVGLTTLALGYGVGRLGGWGMGKVSTTEQRTFAFSLGTHNYGYIPLPLCLALFDRETLGVLFLHNLGVETGLWTLGVAVLTGAGSMKNWRKFLNGPLMAVLFGVFLHATGAASHVPVFVTSSMRMLGQCSIPLALVLIGATIMDFSTEITQIHDGMRTVTLACALRLGLLPLAFLALARWLPCSIELKRVIVLQAAMPAAIFPILMAKHYGGDLRMALRVALGTSLAGLVTIPFWIQLGLRWIRP